MITIKFRKQLDINTIGKTKFYIGLSIGILFLLGTFVNSMIHIRSGIYIKHYLTFREIGQIFVHYFGIVAYASGIVIFTWFFRSNRQIKNKRRNIRLGLTQITICLIIFNTYIFNASPFTHNPVELQQMYDMLSGPHLITIKLLTAPLLFYINWNMIRLALNCRKFIFINMIIGISFAITCTLLHCL